MGGAGGGAGAGAGGEGVAGAAFPDADVDVGAVDDLEELEVDAVGAILPNITVALVQQEGACTPGQCTEGVTGTESIGLDLTPPAAGDTPVYLTLDTSSVTDLNYAAIRMRCPEVCDNGVDDDIDGLTDANDPDCG